MSNYGETIQKLRKQNNLTQADLGEKLNVSYQAVSKRENNLSQPDFDTIKKMMEIFDISMDTFTSMIEETSDESDITASTVAAIETKSKNCSDDDIIIGVCTNCGTTVKNSNLGENEPTILCSKCFNKYTENERNKQNYITAMTKIRQGKRWRNIHISYIVGGIVALIVLFGKYT